MGTVQDHKESKTFGRVSSHASPSHLFPPRKIWKQLIFTVSIILPHEAAKATPLLAPQNRDS